MSKPLDLHSDPQATERLFTEALRNHNSALAMHLLAVGMPIPNEKQVIKQHLIYAISLKEQAVLETMLSSGYSLDDHEAHIDYLKAAIRNGQVRAIHILVERGVNPDPIDHNSSVLHQVARGSIPVETEQQQRAAAELIRLGLDLKREDSSGYTAEQIATNSSDLWTIPQAVGLF